MRSTEDRRCRRISEAKIDLSEADAGAIVRRLVLRFSRAMVEHFSQAEIRWLAARWCHGYRGECEGSLQGTLELMHAVAHVVVDRVKVEAR